MPVFKVRNITTVSKNFGEKAIHSSYSGMPLDAYIT